jgi:hypothetical protein
MSELPIEKLESAGIMCVPIHLQLRAPQLSQWTSSFELRKGERLRVSPGQAARLSSISLGQDVRSPKQANAVIVHRVFMWKSDPGEIQTNGGGVIASLAPTMASLSSTSRCTPRNFPV